MTREGRSSDGVDAPTVGASGPGGSRRPVGSRREPLGPFREPVRFAAVDAPDEGTMIYDRQVAEAWIQSDYAIDLADRSGRPRHHRNRA